MMGDAPAYGEGRLISGRYRLLCALGAGGTGRVWLAYDEELACVVSLEETALPDVPMDASEPVVEVSPARAEPRAWGGVARARGEAGDGARLRGHPRVATVHEGLVAEAADGESALGTAVQTLPDVLLSDIGMPGPDGFELLPGGPASDAPSVRVVVVAAVDLDEYAHVALHDGAYGFLRECSYVVLLLRMARSAMNGDSLGGPEMTTRLPKRLDPDGPAVSTRGVELTPREREVAGLVADGLTNTDIGAALFISQGTVKTHLANLQRKLKVRNRVGIAAWAWQSGLREPSRAVK